MQVRVLFFGVLKDLAGRSSDLLSLPDHARAADVLSHYEQRLSAMKGKPQLHRHLCKSGICPA